MRSQILGLPVRLAPRYHGRGRLVGPIGHGQTGLPGQGTHHLVAVHRDARPQQLAQNRRQHRGGGGRVHQQGLGGVAHAEAAALRVHDDIAGHGGVGRGVHVHVAVARARLDDRHLRVLDAVADKPGAPAGDEHVHQAMQLHEHVGGGPIGGGDGADGTLGQAGPHGGGRQNVGDGLVGAGCEASAPQHAGVARLHADAGGIGGHVGPRLVDHGHHAKGHRHAAQADAVVQGGFQGHHAEGVGQLPQLVEGIGHGAHPGLVQHEPVQQGLARTGRPGRVHIAPVGLHDLGCVLPQSSLPASRSPPWPSSQAEPLRLVYPC